MITSVILIDLNFDGVLDLIVTSDEVNGEETIVSFYIKDNTAQKFELKQSLSNLPPQ